MESMNTEPVSPNGQPSYPMNGQPVPPNGQQPYPMNGQPIPPHAPGNMSPRKKPSMAAKIFKGAGLGLLMLLAFMAVQIFISVAMMVPVMVKHMIQYGQDMDAVMNAYMAEVQEPSFLTNVVAVSTVATTTLAVVWYKFGVVKKYTSVQWNEFVHRAVRLRTAAMIVVTAIGGYFFALLIVTGIGALFPTVLEDYNEMIGDSLGGNQILVMLLVVFLAPIGEECALRGVILKHLLKYFSVPAAVVLQAVFFSIYHANIVQAVYVLPLGIALGITAVKTRSVLPSILLHMLYNSMSMVVVFLPDACAAPWFFALMSAVSAVVLVLLWKLPGKKSETNME